MVRLYGKPPRCAASIATKQLESAKWLWRCAMLRSRIRRATSPASVKYEQLDGGGVPRAVVVGAGKRVVVELRELPAVVVIRVRRRPGRGLGFARRRAARG